MQFWRRACYLFIGVVNGGGDRSSSIEMPPIIKIITAKRYVFFSISVSLSILAYNSIRVQQTNINNQVGGLGPLKSNFCHQILIYNRIYDKTKIYQGKYSVD